MTAAHTDRSAPAALRSCRMLVEPALRAAVDSLPAPVRHIVGYHRCWWNEDGVPTDLGGGKAIRPALALLSAEAVGADRGSAVPAAVAAELVHDFSLLHDDVMDRDLTRRHRPTAWAVFGAGPAILTGDALLVLAVDVLASSELPGVRQSVRLLCDTVQELVDGQTADLAFERRDDVRLDECLRMAEAKTGALLGGACALGALFGGAEANQVDELKGFGRELGLAFQLVDDLLGIWGDPRTTGKPVHSDLRHRKKSLPVVAALTSGAPEGRELAEFYGREGQLTEADLSRAATLIELTGARSWCRDRADELTGSALRRLPEQSPASTQLRALAALLVNRDH
jgi:geranylgeranyl diphosphate synthase, type I